jgi:hypothetical protein
MHSQAARVLKTKIRHADGRQWYLWATPSEVLYIVDCWKLEACQESHVAWARDCVRRGESTPRHFYFNMLERDRLRLRIGA